MLHEIKNVKQEKGTGRRRWFESDGLELVMWFDAADRVAGFQLCYHLGQDERALTWREAHGFVHNAIDTGDASPLKNETPVLTRDDHVPWHDIEKLFDSCSATLEPALRRIVREKLAERAGASAEL